MSTCKSVRAAPLRCPSKQECLAAILALLPKGRAWQSHEGGPLSGIDRGFSPDAFNRGAFSTKARPASVLMQFWAAVAEVVAFVNQRFCDLRLEFWCATQVETRDLWMREYGLPDECDPFPDLCSKVSAIGGSRCEYYAAVAARAGWAIACTDGFNSCGTLVGSRHSLAGRQRPGRRRAAKLLIQVFLAESPAFTGVAHKPARAGRLRAGRRLGCEPNLNGLQCLLARIVHAEVQLDYEVFT